MQPSPTSANTTLKVGMMLAVDGGRAVFYPVSYLYRVCPAAPSIGTDDLYALIEQFPVRIG